MRDKVGQRFEAFLDHVMSFTDPKYRERSKDLWLMFRNGAVHEFEPAELENNQGQLVRWTTINPNPWIARQYPNCSLGGVICNVTHLEPVQVGPAHVFYLPLVVGRLVEDLDAAIAAFSNMGPTSERITLWNRAARDLRLPKARDFKV